MSQFDCFYSVFSLGEQKRHFQKHFKKSYRSQTVSLRDNHFYFYFNSIQFGRKKSDKSLDCVCKLLLSFILHVNQTNLV